MDRASLNREHVFQKKLAHQPSKPELNILLQSKFEREQKFLEDTFAKVTIKRAEKDKYMRKMEKDMKENIDTKIGDRREKDEHK